MPCFEQGISIQPYTFFKQILMKDYNQVIPTTKFIMHNIRKIRYLSILIQIGKNIYTHLASSVKSKTGRNLLAFQITINGFWASNHPSFQIFTPD